LLDLLRVIPRAAAARLPRDKAARLVSCPPARPAAQPADPTARPRPGPRSPPPLPHHL